MNVNKKDLILQKAEENHWEEIVNLLKENHLDVFFTGEENHENFYLVKDSSSNKIINCFAIYTNETIGILKQFAVSKLLQKKGLGTYIANNFLLQAAKDIGLTKLYLQGGNTKPFTSMYFWNKTVFEQIYKEDIEDQYVVNYLSHLEKSLPEQFDRNATFYINLA